MAWYNPTTMESAFYIELTPECYWTALLYKIFFISYHWFATEKTPGSVLTKLSDVGLQLKL